MPDDFKPDDPLSRTAFLLRAVRPVSVRCIEKIVRLSGNVIVESPGNSQAERYLNGVKKWIQDVAVELDIQNFDINNWIIERSPQDLPQQEDSFSCGVFM